MTHCGCVQAVALRFFDRLMVSSALTIKSVLLHLHAHRLAEPKFERHRRVVRHHLFFVKVLAHQSRPLLKIVDAVHDVIEELGAQPVVRQPAVYVCGADVADALRVAAGAGVGAIFFGSLGGSVGVFDVFELLRDANPFAAGSGISKLHDLGCRVTSMKH